MKLRFIACVVGIALAAPIAASCPGPSAEKYLFWSRLPDLREGEVAIEVDIKDALLAPERYETDGSRIFHIKRVLVGDLHTPAIAVDEESGSCTRNIVGGPPGRKIVVDRLLLVGHLEKANSTDVRLIPRYMPFSDLRRYGAAAADEE
ncbi:MAG: hypothetical protein C6Y20_21685 [Tagaea sp. CACIAM 22H2]|nr:hypothetical protein [Tagaea sp. CACIAM 22H2]